MERSDLMKKTLRIEILTEMKEIVQNDLNMLQDFNFVTSDIREKSNLIVKINHAKNILNEINEMIEEL